MIPRLYEPLSDYLRPNRALVIYGPRQVGKTTLLQRFLQTTSLRYKLDSGDDMRVRLLLGSQEFSRILEYLEGYQLYALDEAQEIPHIGKALKIIVDNIPGIRVIATGSSSFSLAGEVGEPLTGRKRTLLLYPLAQEELFAIHNRYELRQNLSDFLVYGTYPEVVTSTSRRAKQALISEIAHSYLLKDILAFERVRHSRLLWNLLQLLAYQIGHEVSLNELATQLGANLKTIRRYLDLLEQTFVIQRVHALSRNPRKEVTGKVKYYFCDPGIRNAVIARFAPLEERDDVGALWENFVFMERLKYRAYHTIPANVWYWRTYTQQEIDLVEEREGQLFGYECKWNPRRKVSAPSAWNRLYPQARFQVISPENYLSFVSPHA